MPDPATSDPWARLVAARAEGRFTANGDGASRHLVFSDGTVWFPGVHEQATGGSVALPLLGSLFVACLGGAIVGWHDGAMWAWWFAGGLLLSGALIALAVRAANRTQAERERRLATGLFLLDDAVVIREVGLDRRVARDGLTGTAVRTFFPAGSGAVERLDLIGRDGARTHTDLRVSARSIVDDWIAGGGNA